MEFHCFCGKCQVTRKNVDTGSDSDFGPYQNNISRAGAFIYTDEEYNRSGSFIHTVERYVLLVQSYNGKWGPPKGRVEPNESSFDCAVRETYEETGIDISQIIDAKSKRTLNGKWDIYPIRFNTRVKIEPMSDEITGYGWVSIGCISRNKRRLNHPCKLALREFMDVRIM